MFTFENPILGIGMLDDSEAFGFSAETDDIIMLNVVFEYFHVVL